MDRLEAMSVLVAAVETGSLSAAGRKLRTPLPTVSRKVSELEAHLGTRLLIRSTRRLTLTDAGAAYVAASKRILDQVTEAERAAAGEHSAPRGELIVTAPVAFGRLHVLPVIDAFLPAFPEIDIRLVLSDRNVRLIDDDIDMAVRIGALPDSTMVATRIGFVRRVVCGSPDFFAGHVTPKVPQDLAGLACVTFDALASPTEWQFPGITVPIRSRLSVNTAEAAIDAAVAGVGVTRVLSYQAALAVRDGKLQVVLAAFEPEPLPVHLLHAAQGSLPLKMRAFLDFAAPRLRQALAAIAAEA
jgi:DNA-binding transcriptional LysR family regulator